MMNILMRKIIETKWIDDNMSVEINIDENNSLMGKNNNNISNNLEHKNTSLFERLLLLKKYIEYKDLIKDLKTKKIIYKGINIDLENEYLLNIVILIKSIRLNILKIKLFEKHI